VLSAATFSALGVLLVGCQLIQRERELYRLAYPTFARYEDVTVSVSVVIENRSWLVITVQNVSESSIVIDWMNAYYLNSHGYPEELMLIEGDKELVRLESATVEPGEFQQYKLYPNPVLIPTTVLVSGGFKGSAQLSHDYDHPIGYSSTIAHPTKGTFVSLPVSTEGEERVIRIEFE